MTSSKAAQAWDFLSWTMSDDAQIEVIAKGKGVPVRTDLASNKYSSADPRIVTINGIVAKGKTPYARNFNASFNDPQSPWLATCRGALFGDAGKALSDGNTAITKSLQSGLSAGSGPVRAIPDRTRPAHRASGRSAREAGQE